VRNRGERIRTSGLLVPKQIQVLVETRGNVMLFRLQNRLQVLPRWFSMTVSLHRRYYFSLNSDVCRCQIHFRYPQILAQYSNSPLTGLGRPGTESPLGGTRNYYYRDAAYGFRRFDVTTRQRIVPPER